MSRSAANSKAEYIVFCGVHFMASDVSDAQLRELGIKLRNKPKVATEVVIKEG